jgi:CheY-like chemotaxis protein
VIRVLMFAPDGMESELQGSLLSREDVELHRVETLEAAQEVTRRLPVHLILVDRDLPSSEKIVATLRKESPTRSSSIVAIARGDFISQEAEILEAGANAVLRLPVAPDWDLRLTRLVSIPGRREVRLAVRFKVYGLWGEEKVPALALNLSLNGMLVEAQTELKVGDEIGLTFEVPTSDTLISGKGRVVRKAGSLRVGLEFLELEGTSPRELGEFLASESGL